MTQCEDITSKSEQEVLYIVEITHSLSHICKHLIERSLQEVQIVDDMKKMVFKEDEDFHRSPIFGLTSMYTHIVELSEKILSTSFTNDCKILCLTPNKELNSVFNKSKNNAIETINLLLGYIFLIKKNHGHKFLQEETLVINEFIQRFENHLKFCLTQLHEVTIGIFTSNVELTYEVYHKILLYHK